MRISVVSLLLCAAALPAGAQESSIDLAEARRAFEAARRASEADGGRLWGVELYGPVYLVDPATRFVAADRPAPEGGLEERNGVWVGTLPESVNPANSAVDWGGHRWTMVLWPTPSVPHVLTALFLHEMFHRVQSDVGLPANDPPNAHLDTRDARIWLRLEMRALAAALVGQGAARKAAIEDALAFRARRQELFPGSAADEDALERNEGMAEYTGLALSGLPPRVMADRAAVGLDGRDRSESFSRSFAYATGPAYGVLLDESGAAWREDFVGGDALPDLLSRAYEAGATPPGPESRISVYAGERVVTEEARREERHLARVADYRTRLVEGPVLRLAPDSGFSFSFDPNDAVPIEGGTVYGASRVTDVWGVLEVESGGALFLRNEKGWITGVIVPAPANAAAAPTAGDGWSLALAEGWRIAPGERVGDWMVVRSEAAE